MRDIRAYTETAVAEAVTEYAMWLPGATLVAAVSGGADSLCLLGALLALRDNRHPLAPRRVVVAHLDHGLRGEAGAGDARWVAAFAAEHGLECVVERAQVRQLARAEHRSLEDAARRARYTFLRRVARETGAVRICTGHTCDDQAETLIMRWLRGSGLAGLTGMAPLTGDLARPLLDLSRADTVAYCASRGWEPRVDATNADTTYLRNRIRHELLPLLEGYNPNLRDTLVRNATLLAEDERYLEGQTDAAWTASVSRDASDSITLALPLLIQLPPALRRRVLRRAAARLLGEGNTLEARHIFAVERLLTSGTSGDSLSLPGGLRARREYAAIIFEHRMPGAVPLPTRRGEPEKEVPQPDTLLVPGSLDLPTLGWRLRAHIVPHPLDATTLWAPCAPLIDTATGTSLPAPRAYLDADTAGDALLIRAWRRGDRFQPLGMDREKKLQDFFTDAKIPRALRARLPLVFGAGSLLWVAGLRTDERARVRDTTTRILVLDLEALVS